MQQLTTRIARSLRFQIQSPVIEEILNVPDNAENHRRANHKEETKEALDELEHGESQFDTQCRFKPYPFDSAPTISGKSDCLIHPYEPRKFTIREYARVQSFPDSYTFCGTMTETWKQVRDAVPPQLSHSLGESLMKIISTPTVGEVVTDTPEDDHEWNNHRSDTVDRIETVSQGGNWKDIPEELRTSGMSKSKTHSQRYKRLRSEAPSVTIANFRKSVVCHPNEDRMISVREALRIQSFSDEFSFPNISLNEKQQIVANAVPPRLAESIGESLSNQISTPSMGEAVEGVSDDTPNQFLPSHSDETVEEIKELEHGDYLYGTQAGLFLNPDRPAPTITSRPNFLIHPYKNRRMTIREYARLQTFEDGFVFADVGQFDQMDLVKNAVPPQLAESIASNLEL